MAQKNFIMDVARLMVAAAWADGRLSNSEINALKDLLFTLEDVDAQDWKELDIYIDSPVSPEETQQLLGCVMKSISSANDKALVLDMLRKLFESDGCVTSEEQELLDEIEKSVSAVDTGILSKLSKALKSAVARRTAHAETTSSADEKLDDYVKNIVYCQLQREEEQNGVRIDLPETELRKLCLATGLLARVANVDADMSDQERDAIRDIIAADWSLASEQAGVLVRVACDRTTKGLDYFRLSHGFFVCTSLEERKDFLKTLFKVANASEKTSHDEIEQIRRVANSLKLSHKDFIDAKLTIPREDRNGL